MQNNVNISNKSRRFLEELKKITDENGKKLSFYAIAKMDDKKIITESKLSHVKNGRNDPSKELIDRLCEIFPTVDKVYILLGDYDKEDVVLKREVTPVPEDAYMMAEYADLSGRGGRLGGADVQNLPDTKVRLVPREYEKGKYLVVRVEGNSMDDGTSRSLSDGDEILVRELDPDEWINLPIRNRLFVITSRDGNVIKQIKEVNYEERFIVCHSFNNKVEDYPIYFDDIYQIFIIYKIVQKQIRL